MLILFVLAEAKSIQIYTNRAEIATFLLSLPPDTLHADEVLSALKCEDLETQTWDFGVYVRND